MATGEAYRSLRYQFRVSFQYISVIVMRVTRSIVNRMLNDKIPKPTAENFKMNAEKFAHRWNYPNAVGAIDGKHVRITCPSNSGSAFFNYKQYFSIVLMALVDADCKYIAIEVGSYGAEGDAGNILIYLSFSIRYIINYILCCIFAGIFAKCAFGRAIAEGKFGIPPPAALPMTETILPHVILGDEAFSLTENMMKPYPRPQSLADETKAVYNYRHSRARRTTENTFGLTASYFRVFHHSISLKPENIDYVVTAACILHNCLRESKILAPGQANFNEDIPLPSDSCLVGISANRTHNANRRAYDIRDEFRNYFNSVGSVDFQHELALRS